MTHKQPRRSIELQWAAQAQHPATCIKSRHLIARNLQSTWCFCALLFLLLLFGLFADPRALCQPEHTASLVFARHSGAITVFPVSSGHISLFLLWWLSWLSRSIHGVYAYGSLMKVAQSSCLQQWLTMRRDSILQSNITQLSPAPSSSCEPLPNITMSKCSHLTCLGWICQEVP